jgi:hypothetical protein
MSLNVDFKWFDSEDDYMPVVSGGLLGMSRRWWQETEGYDKHMAGWGGENIDQSLRVWLCGGEIMHAPASRVAHMWRGQDPRTQRRYSIPGNSPQINRLRAAAGWYGTFLDKAKTFPDLRGISGLGDLTDYERLKEKLACRDLGWFLKRFSFIYRDAGLIPDRIFRLEAGGMCLQYTRGKGTSPDGRGNVNLARCSSSEAQFFGPRNRKTARESAARECCNGFGAWDTDQCFSHLNGGSITTTVCDVAGRNWQQLWAFDANGHITIPGGCLQADVSSWKVYKVKCTQPEVTVWKIRDETVPLEKKLYDQSIQGLSE